MAYKMIVLDRDGVINQDSDDYIRHPDDWQPIPGSIEAIARLHQCGFRIVVATNQSGIGRGYYDEHVLARMHEKMHDLVEAAGGEIAGVFYCPHLPAEDCSCRKPRTGLLDRIEQEFDISLQGSWFIGDSRKDLDCALAKGCLPGLVLSGKGCRTYLDLEREVLERIQVFDDLDDAARFILATDPRFEQGSL